MDPQTFTAWINALIGALSSIIIAYGALKAKGLIIYPAAKLEAGKARLKEAGKLLEVLDNISPDELAKILEEAGKRYQDGSFSALDAQKVGVMIFEAIKEK